MNPKEDSKAITQKVKTERKWGKNYMIYLRHNTNWYIKCKWTEQCN